jgi:RecJ-like exonuclease
MPSLGGPCWNCHGEGVIRQHALTPACSVCGGTGDRADAERITREHEAEERARAQEHAQALAELRALREKRVNT